MALIQPRKTIFHFAYGANMNPKQIGARCSWPKVVGAARLSGYSLAFFGHTRVWDGGMETVVPDPGHDLWGVLYELSVADGDGLDGRQDVRIDGTGAYFHYPVTVTDRDGNRWEAAIYKKDVLGRPRPPSQEYLAFIVQGAVANGLPEEYVEELRKILSVPASYPVPRLPEGGSPQPHTISCSDCGDPLGED